MNFSNYAEKSRNHILAQLKLFLEDKAQTLGAASRNPDELFHIFQDYSSSGKMLRGTLTMLGYDLCKKRNFSAFSSKPAIKLAAAQELFQAGLLVHDDIMDGDVTRRGKPTMHKIFEQKSHQMSRSSAEKLGESLGICAGDIFYFLAWQLLPAKAPKLNILFSDELTKVCLAQMQDVELGGTLNFPSLQEILNVYTYKTARYTIALPLIAGAALAGTTDFLPSLEEIGINLGIMFQLQDDYLGLYADETALGKPLGSDIREGKKTPFMILLNEKLSSEERLEFSRIFGNKNISSQDVALIRSFLEKHSITSQVKSMMYEYAQHALDILNQLTQKSFSLNQSTIRILLDFVEYSFRRTF